ncbi:MAG: nucleotidyltransferase domain-containing protein, partial [Candidatus Hydrogenedentales bacterium]
VREFSLFGSVLRDDFRADSDVDVLISFDEDEELHISLWELAEMKTELESLFGRKVDLVEKEALVNPFRRKAILGSREIIYADVS